MILHDSMAGAIISVAFVRVRKIRVFIMATAKEELKALLDQQPEDSSAEELIRELAFHAMIQRGIADSDAGRVYSNEEMEQRIRSWRK